MIQELCPQCDQALPTEHLARYHRNNETESSCRACDRARRDRASHICPLCLIQPREPGRVLCLLCTFFSVLLQGGALVINKRED